MALGWGIEVNAGAEERNFGFASEVLPWLQHWYGLGSRDARSDELEMELQKIYDSEINVTIRVGGNDIPLRSTTWSGSEVRSHPKWHRSQMNESDLTCPKCGTRCNS
jgi:hypothetical protein